jgi:ribonucleoside-triphosphate reductase
MKIEELSIESEKYKKFFKAWQYAKAMTEKETRQAAEGMIHNLNTLQSRSGNQLPFSSVNYGTCTEEEGRMVTKAILETTIRGTGNGQTSIFPCQIFQKKKGVNDKGSKNYDLYQLAVKCTSKRMYPNYCNCDWSNDQDINDKAVKEEILSSLSEEERNTLMEKIKNNPQLGEYLGLEVE